MKEIGLDAEFSTVPYSFNLYSHSNTSMCTVFINPIGGGGPKKYCNLGSDGVGRALTSKLATALPGQNCPDQFHLGGRGKNGGKTIHKILNN